MAGIKESPNSPVTNTLVGDCIIKVMTLLFMHVWGICSAGSGSATNKNKQQKQTVWDGAS